MAKKLSSFSSKLKPRRSLILAADGPGPYAKVLTQRQRRTRTANSGVNEDQSPRINSAELTPGTRLMVMLDGSLHKYAQGRLSKMMPHDRTLVITVSGPQVLGEGELKLSKHLFSICRGPKKNRGPESHVLVGGDSDLLLMVLASGVVASPGEHVRGINVDSHEVTVAALKPPKDVYFSSTRAASALARQLQGGSNSPSPVPVHEAALDLVAMFIMGSGNDYIPVLRGCTIDSLWFAYLSLRSPVALGRPAHAEADLGPLVVVSKFSPSNENAEKSFSATLNRPLLALMMEICLERPEKFRGFPERPPTDWDEKTAAPYLAAVEWNLDMYITGVCPNYRLGYIAQTSAAAVRKVCMDSGDDRREGVSAGAVKATHHPQQMPPPPAIYNLLVQPLALSRLVAPKLRPLMEEGENSPIGWLYAHGCRCVTCLVLSYWPLSQFGAMPRHRLTATLVFVKGVPSVVTYTHRFAP